MGNRAIVLPEGSKFGVYLHWYGGPDSVRAFLEYCKLKHHRDFGGVCRDGYGIARFCQVVGNFLGGNVSIGIEPVGADLDEEARGLDNGIYVVRKWDVIERHGRETPGEGYPLTEMLLDIDRKQPESERLGQDYILSKLVSPDELNDGDEVFLWDDVYDKPFKTRIVKEDGATKCIDQFGRIQHIYSDIRRKEN